MAKWDATQMPSLAGRSALVTGASSGLGLVTARELARAGAHVLMGCRNLEKGEGAAHQIRTEAPGADVTVVPIDLADLASVEACAAEVQGRLTAGDPPLHLLVNNAGVMAPPRRLTRDGFESQFGTNHLGHFALTGHLLGALLRSPRARVVTVSSGAHRIGWIRFDDPQWERAYHAWLAYGQSKLANLMFAFELARRAAEADADLSSMAAHPGYAATNLQFAGPAHLYERAFMAVSNRVVAQSAEMGALPTLYAAVADIPSGSFVGPDGFMEQRGHPRLVSAAGRAYDEDQRRRLWELSERLTGVHYDFAT